MAFPMVDNYSWIKISWNFIVVFIKLSREACFAYSVRLTFVENVKIESTRQERLRKIYEIFDLQKSTNYSAIQVGGEDSDKVEAVFIWRRLGNLDVVAC